MVNGYSKEAERFGDLDRAVMEQIRACEPPVGWKGCYTRWRHGGWHVVNVRYPSGAVGCVSNNYPDRKWRVACDSRPFDQRATFATREEAARHEYTLAKLSKGA